MDTVPNTVNQTTCVAEVIAAVTAVAVVTFAAIIPNPLVTLKPHVPLPSPSITFQAMLFVVAVPPNNNDNVWLVVPAVLNKLKFAWN